MFRLTSDCVNYEDNALVLYRDANLGNKYRLWQSFANGNSKLNIGIRVKGLGLEFLECLSPVDPPVEKSPRHESEEHERQGDCKIQL